MRRRTIPDRMVFPSVNPDGWVGDQGSEVKWI